MGANARAIDHRDRPIDLVVVGRFGLDLGQDSLPDARRLSTPKAAVDGLPGAVPLRQIPPWCTRAQDPEDAIEDHAMILGRTTGCRALRWQQRLEAVPLLVGEFMSSHAPRLPPLCRQALVDVAHHVEATDHVLQQLAPGRVVDQEHSM